MLEKDIPLMIEASAIIAQPNEVKCMQYARVTSIHVSTSNNVGNKTWSSRGPKRVGCATHTHISSRSRLPEKQRRASSKPEDYLDRATEFPG
jgi:hypothetical protein